MFGKKECQTCKALQKTVDYQQRIIDRLLADKGMQPIKDKKLKVAEMITHEDETVPAGKEFYGDQ